MRRVHQSRFALHPVLASCSSGGEIGTPAQHTNPMPCPAHMELVRTATQRQRRSVEERGKVPGAGGGNNSQLQRLRRAVVGGKKGAVRLGWEVQE